MRFLLQHRLLVSIAGTFLLAVVLSRVVDAISVSENVDHAASHLAIGVPGLVLAWSIAFWCPHRKDTRTARWGRRASVAGLVMISAGLVLESIGAFGYDGEDAKIPALTTLHNASWLIQFPGLPILLVGITLALISLFQRTPATAATAG